MHTNWRKAQEWADSGLTLSSVSDQACRLYDAALTQYVSWCEQEDLGGLENTLVEMQAADPHFVMGHVLAFGLDALSTGRSIVKDAVFREHLEHFRDLAKHQQLTSREALHVKAITHFANKNHKWAAEVWEEILIKHPTDMMAIKFAHDTYFFTGQQRKIRDSIGRILPLWDASKPLYGYLYGMYGFGLVETNFHDKAIEMAMKGLEINKYDAWSTHAIAHVNEMRGTTNEGIKFLNSTEDDWKKCGLLACHNYWHLGLYHIENGHTAEALSLYESNIRQFAKHGSILDIVDATSMLMRLEMEGISTKTYWREIYNICEPHLDDHITAFNEVHFLFACLGAKQVEAVEMMKDFLKTDKIPGTTFADTREIEEKLVAGIIAFDNQDYEITVNMLEPIRYDNYTIGGSDAQRDIFNIMLIVAALKSTNPQHNDLARVLVYEREAFKLHSPMTQRLVAKAISHH